MLVLPWLFILSQHTSLVTDHGGPWRASTIGFLYNQWHILQALHTLHCCLQTIIDYSHHAKSTLYVFTATMVTWLSDQHTSGRDNHCLFCCEIDIVISKLCSWSGSCCYRWWWKTTGNQSQTAAVRATLTPFWVRRYSGNKSTIGIQFGPSMRWTRWNGQLQAKWTDQTLADYDRSTAKALPGSLLNQ